MFRNCMSTPGTLARADPAQLAASATSRGPGVQPRIVRGHTGRFGSDGSQCGCTTREDWGWAMHVCNKRHHPAWLLSWRRTCGGDRDMLHRHARGPKTGKHGVQTRQPANQEHGTFRPPERSHMVEAVVAPEVCAHASEGAASGQEVAHVSPSCEGCDKSRVGFLTSFSYAPKRQLIIMHRPTHSQQISLTDGDYE